MDVPRDVEFQSNNTFQGKGIPSLTLAVFLKFIFLSSNLINAGGVEALLVTLIRTKAADAHLRDRQL